MRRPNSSPRLVFYFLWSAISLCAVWSEALWAKEEKWTHYGLRPLAMGNAYVAVADDFNALFYNPAGLARLKAWDGELLNPTIELSKSTGAFLTNAQSLQSGSAGDGTAVLDLLESQTGKVQHLAFGLTPHLIFPGIGFGIGFELASSMVFHRYPTIFLDIGPRVIAPLAVATNFLEDRLSIGFGVKAVLDGGIEREFSIQDLEALSEEESSKGGSEPKLSDYVQGGIGYGADFGLLFTPMKVLEPTLGISVADIGSTPYKQMNFGGDALGKPQPRLAAVNVGYSMKPIQTQRSYLMTSIDAHAINQPYSFSKKLNMGLEWGLGTVLKVQTGLHQGYLTGGLQFDVGILNVRLVSYSEEMGEVAGTIEDRRYALQLKLII